ncbi:MAG: hypothetical protein HYU99_04500 [Deltaproteobacteria bacterium]|nr:hypothetical protein [Deltaproteobacteria bacterium]
MPVFFTFISFLLLCPAASAQTIIPGIDRVEMLKTTSDEKIIVAGIAGRGKKADFAVVRLNRDLTVDRTFGRDGVVRVDAGGKEYLYGLAIRPDGKIIIAGFTRKGKKAAASLASDFALARLNPHGELDLNFGTNGLVITDIGARDEIHFIATTPSGGATGDGSIVSAGFTEENDDSDFIIARYRPNGLPDATFGKNGIVRIDETRDDRLYGVALGSERRIIATGSVHNKASGKEECIVIALTAGGRRDKTFGNSGMARVGALREQNICSSVVVQPDGRIVVAGFARRAAGDTDFLIARLRPNGKPDRTFGSDGIQFVDFKNGIDAVHALAIDTRGRLVAAGDVRLAGDSQSQGDSRRSGTGFIALARLLPNGRLDSQFGREGKATMFFGGHSGGEVTSMTLIGTQKIVGGQAGTKGMIAVLRRRADDGKPDGHAEIGVEPLGNRAGISRRETTEVGKAVLPAHQLGDDL